VVFGIVIRTSKLCMLILDMLCEVCWRRGGRRDGILLAIVGCDEDMKDPRDTLFYESSDE
jgi:hypothetical protein